MDCSEERVIVIELGADSTKVGFAGNWKPTAVIPSVIGKPKYGSIRLATVPFKTYVGNEALKMSPFLDLTYIIKDGRITDWPAFSLLIGHIYKEKLQAKSSKHPVLLLGPFLDSSKDLEYISYMFFDTFKVPGLCIQDSATMIFRYAGIKSGIIVDSGYESTRVVPFVDYKRVDKGVFQMEVGRKHLVERMVRILSFANTDLECDISSTSGMKAVKKIIENHCYVAEDLEYELKNSFHELVENCYLPDGQPIKMYDGRIMCPELMFNYKIRSHPGLYGLHDLIWSSI